MAAFLAPWLDTEAVPELGVRWRPADGGTLVEVTQHQDGPFFPLTVPVRVHAGAESRDLRLRMDSILAGSLVQTTAAVDSVVLDPDGWLLFRTAASPPPRLLAAQPRPNPAVGTVHLAYWLAAADRVTATVYDVRGRRIRRDDLGVQHGLGPDDPLLWTWDGRDDQGRGVAAGVYWLELRTPDDRTVRKVTFLH